MIRSYDTNALWRHDEILRIRHLEAEIAARQEEIERLIESKGELPPANKLAIRLGWKTALWADRLKKKYYWWR